MAEPTQWALNLARKIPMRYSRTMEVLAENDRCVALALDAARQQGYREGIASEEARHNAAAFKACEREISRLKHENKDLRECIRAMTPEDKT
jgi:hypothetical protein